MASDRVQRQIDRLLDQAEKAVESFDWATVQKCAQAALDLSPDNADAEALAQAAERALTRFSDEASREPGRPSEAIPTQAAEPPAPLLPSSFSGGRYAVRSLLGEGGKKTVYLAHDERLDRDVAFALIRSEALDEPGRTRVMREAQAMAKLGEHPCLMPIYDTGDDDGRPYLVLPLMPGGDVEQLLADQPEHRLPLEQAVGIAKQVARGLEFAHGKGIVHRDLKPGNVWLTNGGEVKIGDFGLAVSTNRSRLTQEGMMVGTATYMAPEQAMGSSVTPQADLYSLGAMLYEMVTGQPPFIGDDNVAIITQHLNTPPLAPSWHRRDCPVGLEALIQRLLEKDPSKRPTSASEVFHALDAIDLNATPAPTAPPTPPQSTNPIYRRTFVGRETELKQLQDAFDGAMSGQGALAMVVGEPGIGKTSICEQLATYVAMRGGRTLVGHSYEEGSLSLPYLPFVEAIHSYVSERDPDALRDELGSYASDVARIVSEVRERVQVEPREATDPEDDRWRLLQSVSGFLRNAAAVQPLVIVLEDLHWADRGTLDLLLHVARNLDGARLLIVGTYRDVEVDRQHPLSGALGEMRRGVPFGRVVLRGLTPDAVHRMLRALTSQDVRWGMAEAIHRQTEGNPLFIQEVMRYLVEEGYISHESGRWTRTGEEAPEAFIPEGLRDVIGKRLTRLSEQCNRVLSIAAVIGRDFDLPVLLEVSGLSEDDLLNALEEADHAAVIEERARTGANLSYRFTHAFFRQTLYEEIFGGRRVRLHQQVGRALEEVYARNLKDHASELAEHFGQSSEEADLQKAVLYGKLGAERAISVFAYGEAVRLLEQALKAQEVLDPDDMDARFTLLKSLGAALLPMGEPERVTDVIASELYDLALRLQGNAKGSIDERAAGVCRLALEGIHRAAFFAAAQHPQWFMWAERMSTHAPEASAAKAYANVALARARMVDDRYQEAVGLFEQGLTTARDCGDPETLLTVAWQAMNAFATMEHWRDTVALGREFGRYPLAGVTARTQGQMAEFCGCAAWIEGDVKTAIRYWQDLSRIAERSSDSFTVLVATSFKTVIAYMDGHLDEAATIAEGLTAKGQELGLPRVGYGMATRAGVHSSLLMGKTTGWLESVWPYMQPMVKPYLLMLAGRHNEAKELAEALYSQVFQGQDFTRIFTYAHYPALLMSVFVEMGNREVVEHLLSCVHDSPPLAPPAMVAICSHRFIGAAYEYLGDQAEAAVTFRKAISICETAGVRPELALSRLGLAEVLLDHYPDEHAEAIKHLDSAIAEFHDMKMQPSLERALRRKQTLGA